MTGNWPVTCVQHWGQVKADRGN